MVLDNASTHKTSAIKTWFQQAGIMAVTLPQYTPEWNPIEKVFSVVKGLVAKANLSSR